MNTTRYAVKHATTGLLFAGFDAQGAPVWGDENTAKPYPTKLDAQTQASLFICMGVHAQRKPATI